MSLLDVIHQTIDVVLIASFGGDGFDDRSQRSRRMNGIVQLMKSRKELLFKGNEERILDTMPPTRAIAHMTHPGFIGSPERVGVPLSKGAPQGVVHVPRKHAPFLIFGFSIKIVILKHVIKGADIIDRADVAQSSIHIEVFR